MVDLNMSHDSTLKEEMDLYLALSEFLKKKKLLTENWTTYQFTFTVKSNDEGPQLCNQTLVKLP